MNLLKVFIYIIFFYNLFNIKKVEKEKILLKEILLWLIAKVDLNLMKTIRMTLFLNLK